MKKALLGILLAIVAVGLAGCEDYDTKPLRFVNSSDHVVTITSLSIEWTGFSLAPGETRKMTDIRDVDFIYEPRDKVGEGFASTDRYIVFVNLDPDIIEAAEAAAEAADAAASAE